MSRDRATRVLTALAVTPIHVGTGQQFGAVDLPIQRDTLGYPVIYSPSFKGALKQACVQKNNEMVEVKAGGGRLIHRAKDGGECSRLFGSDMRPESGIGNVSLTDLRLLFIPARSAERGPVYLTTHYMIDSILELLRLAGGAGQGISQELSALKDGGEGQKMVNVMGISNLPLRGISKDSELAKLFAGSSLYKHLLEQGVAVAGDSVSGVDSSILVDRALMRVTRNRLDLLRKTVVQGALWTEEYIPHGSVFLGLAMEADGGSLAGALGGDFYLNLGGKESIGRGLLRIVVR